MKGGVCQGDPSPLSWIDPWFALIPCRKRLIEKISKGREKRGGYICSKKRGERGREREKEDKMTRVPLGPISLTIFIKKHDFISELSVYCITKGEWTNIGKDDWNLLGAFFHVLQHLCIPLQNVMQADPFFSNILSLLEEFTNT